MQNEWVVTVWLNQSSEICLLNAGINMRVFVVLKNPEHTVQSHVNTRRLNHFRIKWLNGHPFIVDFGQEVPVG
jgi:hypothetical protein